MLRKCVKYIPGMELKPGDMVWCNPYAENSYTMAEIIEKKDEIEYWAYDVSNDLKIRLDDSVIVGVNFREIV